MRTIFIDDEYKCHVNNEDGLYEPIETEEFDGKCDAYIEGYRYIPSERILNYGNGVLIQGKAIMPWKNYAELAKAQEKYEELLNLEQKEALKIMGVSL
jgi:hypothetical protein